MIKKVIVILLSVLFILSAVPVTAATATEASSSEKMLYINTDSAENLMQRAEVQVGKTYYFTFGLSSSLVDFVPVCFTDNIRYSVDADIALVNKQDNGFSATYTYSYTIPATSENGKDMTDLVFFGIKLASSSEGYVFGTSVYEAGDENKTDLFPNSKFAFGLDEWAYGWEAWFAYWEDAGLTEWSDGATTLRIVDYDSSMLFDAEDEKMLHIRFENSETKNEILVQRVEQLLADVEYTISFDYHFMSGDFGGAIYFVLMGDDGNSATVRKCAIDFTVSDKYIISSSDNGYNIEYKIKLDSELIGKYRDFYLGFYFDGNPRMITELCVSNMRLRESNGSAKNLLTKKSFDDMQGWYSHWSEAQKGSQQFGAAATNSIEYLAWYEPCDKQLFTPEIDAIHYGDVDYNGKINIRDLVAIKKKCTDFKSAIPNFDVNADGSINSQDLLTARKHILGVEPIVWNDGQSCLQAAADVNGGAEREAAALRNSIAAAKDTLLKVATSTVYYVAENGSYYNSGKTADKPINFEKLRNLTLRSGDTVLFKRGDTFRIATSYSLVTGVSYGAYGTGEKPVISGSLRDYADGNIWSTEDGFLWKTTVNGEFAANMVFNGGEFVGIPKMTLAEADDDGEFYFDSENKTCYLYLRQRNPGLYFDSIEISTADTLFIGWSNRKNIVLENLSFKYPAKHGMNFISCENIKITGCELSWIGGCFTGTNGGRYGNGIQFWCKAVNCDVSNNYLYQIYDAALTFQGNGYGEYKNISYKNNLVEYSSMNFEFWGEYTNEEDLIISDIDFTDNILRFAGYNFGGLQRNNEHNQAFVLGWYSTYYDSQIKNFNITENVFDIANCNFYYAYDFTHMLNITNNTYYQDSNSDYCININENTYATDPQSFRQAIELIDSNPTVYWQPAF